jgi:hypothetical protein
VGKGPDTNELKGMNKNPKLNAKPTETAPPLAVVVTVWISPVHTQARYIMIQRATRGRERLITELVTARH